MSPPQQTTNKWSSALLIATAHLFLIPICFYVWFFPAHTLALDGMMSLVFLNYLFSLGFWFSPVRGSLNHRIDAVAARVSLVTIILFVSLFGRLSDEARTWFVVIMGLMIAFFYLSDKFSSTKGGWCSPGHIAAHCAAHLCATVALFYLFV